MKRIGSILMLTVLISCGGNQEKLEISAEEIDNYVTVKSDESQIYDVSMSLRFSRESETYEVVEYLQNDSIILHLETFTNDQEQVMRRTFFKSGLPVYIEENIARNTEANPYVQRKIYLDGANIIEGYERGSYYEDELDMVEYEEISVDIEEFDFDKPSRAIHQEGEFEMKFEEFIIINPQTYLILENQESGYDVALFVADRHPLLDTLNTDPEKYKGKTIFVNHQFIMTNNIERMLFIDGFMKESEEVATTD